MKFYEPIISTRIHFRCPGNNVDHLNHWNMERVKFILQIMSFFLIGLPIALCLYLTNEIYWAIKRLFK